jgi:hypothetical protein
METIKSVIEKIAGCLQQRNVPIVVEVTPNQQGRCGATYDRSTDEKIPRLLRSCKVHCPPYKSLPEAR